MLFSRIYLFFLLLGVEGRQLLVTVFAFITRILFSNHCYNQRNISVSCIVLHFSYITVQNTKGHVKVYYHFNIFMKHSFTEKSHPNKVPISNILSLSNSVGFSISCHVTIIPFSELPPKEEIFNKVY